MICSWQSQKSQNYHSSWWDARYWVRDKGTEARLHWPRGLAISSVALATSESVPSVVGGVMSAHLDIIHDSQPARRKRFVSR
jgi:hypothetical protein